MELNGTAAIVTGAARGVGRAIAEAFASQGTCVAIVDVLDVQLKKTASEMRESGATVLPIATDITDVSQVDAMAAKVQDELGSSWSTTLEHSPTSAPSGRLTRRDGFETLEPISTAAFLSVGRL